MTLKESLLKLKEVLHLKGTMHKGAPITDIFPAPNDATFDEFLTAFLKYEKNLALAIKQTGATDFSICILSWDKKGGIIFHDWLE